MDMHKPHLVLGTFNRVSFLKSAKYFSNYWGSSCALFTRFSYCLFLLMGAEGGKVLVEITRISLLCISGCMGTDVWNQLIILNHP